jgi:hypothetical protein
MVLLKQLRKLSNQHLDLEQDVLSGLKMKIEVVRTLDRDMPIGTYTLHLDDGNCTFSSQL